MKKSISGIFLVGCPRSGTSLLQSMLASHPSIWSLPETHFFSEIISRKRRWRVLGLTERHHKALEILVELTRDQEYEVESVKKFLVRHWTERFFHFLNTSTDLAGKEVWLEKTPRHLHFVDLIKRYSNNVVFIHIIRNPVDVVTSLYQVSKKNPHIWVSLSVEGCIRRYVKDISITGQMIARPDHHLVVYENLVDDPITVLNAACDFLGLPFNGKMLDFSEAAGSLVRKEEEWKAGVMKPLFQTNGRRIKEVFGEEERIELMNKLNKSRALEAYERLVNKAG